MPNDSADDEFDRQLRALTGGASGQAGFAEPSAAERARQAARRQAVGRRAVRRQSAAQRRSASWLAGFARRYQPWLLVILILVALVATSIGLSWLSSH
ncbi:MAG: hypothetical protein ACRDRJ_13120 [Streptosporangiaceae bacterium]